MKILSCQVHNESFLLSMKTIWEDLKLSALQMKALIQLANQPIQEGNHPKGSHSSAPFVRNSTFSRGHPTTPVQCACESNKVENLKLNRRKCFGGQINWIWRDFAAYFSGVAHSRHVHKLKANNATAS